MSARRFTALATLLVACAADDPSFPDGGNPDRVDGGAAVMCGAPFGSCRTRGDALCDDYAGAIPMATARESCVAADGTWSDAPCATSGTVGACRFEHPVGDGGQWCTTTWWFPPATTEGVMQTCVAPGMFIPPT